MPKYIALLRGINVGGHKKIKMADLRTILDKLPFQEVKTYIQSGNIVFATDETSTAHLEESIKINIAKTFGFDVPVLVMSKNKIEQIVNDNPYTNPADLAAKKVYYALLKSEPEQEAVANLDQEMYPNELFQITKNCVYLNCKNGAGNAKLTNNIIERKLKVEATTRNHRTMMKLLEMASS